MLFKTCTKVEVFVDKDVREAAPDGEGKRASWRKKNHEISRTSLSINLHF